MQSLTYPLTYVSHVILCHRSLAGVQATHGLLIDITQGPEVRDRIVSITFGRVKQNITKVMRQKFVAAIRSLDEFIIEGAACTERGDSAFRTHLQTMLYMHVNKGENAKEALKKYTLQHMGFNEEGPVRLYIQIRDERGDVTKERQLGYTAKDWGMAHCHIDYLKGVTQRQLKDYGSEYDQVKGHNLFRKRKDMDPYNYGQFMAPWEHKVLWPLNRLMVSYQIVRFMLLSKSYMLSTKWIAATGNNCPPHGALEAYRRMLAELRADDDCSIQDVYMVMDRDRTRNEGRGASIFGARKRVFDTMSFDTAKRKARKVLRRYGGDVLRLTEDTVQELSDGDVSADSSAQSDAGLDSDDNAIAGNAEGREADEAEE